MGMVVEAAIVMERIYHLRSFLTTFEGSTVAGAVITAAIPDDMMLGAPESIAALKAMFHHRRF